MKFYAHLHDLFESYDAFIIDLWGVVHNGVSPYAGALECLTAMKEAEKEVVFLSNAPRRASLVHPQLLRFGIADNLYDLIVSSGDDVCEHLNQLPDDWYKKLGKTYYYLGLERDHLTDSIPQQQIQDIHQASFLLCGGFQELGQVVEDFHDLLHKALDKKIPMICINPDLEVIVGDHRIACAGSLAKYYEEQGGEVRYHGKPHPTVYKSIYTKRGWTEDKRVLAIGDSLHTDIRGALNFGIDSAFVCSGIHGKELGLIHGETPKDPKGLEDLCYHYGIVPKIVLPGLIL